MRKAITAFALVLTVLLTLCFTVGAKAAVTLLGDADCNEEVNINDAATVLRYVVGLTSLSEQGMQNADVNQDKTVNIFDASVILRYCVGLETIPPSGSSATSPPSATPTNTPVPTATPNPSLGDVTLDGDITAHDAAAVLRHAVQINLLTEAGLKNADVNMDGKVNAADAAVILRYVVKLDTIPPKTPGPTAVPTATPTPSPTPTPTPTPIPTNKYGLPAAGSEGLYFGNDDPNGEKMANFYLYSRLWKNKSTSSSASENAANWAYQYVTTANSNNKDVIGWVYMKITGHQNNGASTYSPVVKADKTYYIDEPVMYSGAMTYLDYDVLGVKDVSGALSLIFNRPVKNMVITGHNSRSSRTHFHHLHSLQSGALYYKSVGTLASQVLLGNYEYEISLFGMHQWQIWAMYETEAAESADTLLYNTSPSCDGDTGAWIQKQLSRSQADFGYGVTADDTFLTLYTCGDKYDKNDDTNQARLYIFLVYTGD